MTITSSITPYAPIASLPSYQAGRAADVVAAEHGLSQAIKLASNESPFGPLPSVAASIRAATSASTAIRTSGRPPCGRPSPSATASTAPR